MGVQGTVERTRYGAGQADPSLVPHEKEGFLCAKHCAGHRRYVVSETDKLWLHKTSPPTEDHGGLGVSACWARHGVGWGRCAFQRRLHNIAIPNGLLQGAPRGGIYAPSRESGGL